MCSAGSLPMVTPWRCSSTISWSACSIASTLLDEHYSVITFPAGTTFEEGYTVEKL